MTTALWQACKQGDPQARETLILQHLGYAVLTVKRAVPRIPARIYPEDLEAEATLALIRAVDRFDPQRGVEFKTYAIAMMRGAVLDYLRRDDWVPRSVRGHQKRLEAAELALTLSGRPITPEALADHLGIDVDRLTRLQAIATPRLPLSVEAILADDDEAGRERLTVTNPECGPEGRAIEATEAEELWQTACLLHAHHRRTLWQRYVLGMKYEQIAKAEERCDSAIKLRERGAIRCLRLLIEEREG